MIKCSLRMTRLRHHLPKGEVFQQARLIQSTASNIAHNRAPAGECDYVIVGAGSAGCVLANRLSADESNKVHLLEAGNEDKSWKFHMPAALMYTLADPILNWCYWTTPQKHVNNRKMYWPRAKVWGGCSSHNAMVYIRGNALDYDRWEKEGATGWSYADCLPYFKKSETYDMGEDEYRGDFGFMCVSRGKYEEHPLMTAFVEAGIQAGYPHTKDINGYQQEGFGAFDYTIWQGARSNTSTSFLRPVLYRPNLTVTSGVLTSKILFEGNKAVGVEYLEHGAVKQIRAGKEVILSAGAINTPQLMMLSGVGDSKHLTEMDIPVQLHLPGVGQNLQDHIEVYIQYECKQPVTLYKYQWKYPHHMIRAGVQWFYNKTGPAASTHLDAGAFIRSRPGIEHPDIQYHFLPSMVINHGQETGNCHAYQVHAGTMRPTSRGEIKLASKNPTDYPLLDANYLATEEDKQDFRNLIRLTREIMSQKAFDPFRGKSIQPTDDIESDRDIDAFVREKTDSSYHPSCTCKIGQESDKMAVVNPQCQVYGLESLRVVDASIMPSVVSGNLNGPVVMMAEKAADIILNKPALPKSTAPVYKPKSLLSQR